VTVTDEAFGKQLSFDDLAAQAAVEAGQEQALEADRIAKWRIDADSWLETLRVGSVFTADALVGAIGLPDEGVHRNNAVGAWFGRKSRMGKIVWTGRYARSARVIGHGNQQRVWRVA
jgi:hypothetical protein